VPTGRRLRESPRAPVAAVGDPHHFLAQGVADGLRAVVQVELVEDVADVELDGVLRHPQPLGELAVGGDALHHQLEHLELALGERVGVALGHRLAAAASEGMQYLARQLGRQRRLAEQQTTQEVDEPVGLQVLEQVALGAALEGFEEVGVLGRGGEHDDLGLRARLEELRDRVEPAHLRHRQVHQHDVGLEPDGEVDGFAAVARLGQHLEPVGFEETAEALAEQDVVVGDQQAHGKGSFGGWLIGDAESRTGGRGVRRHAPKGRPPRRWGVRP
jgi:hypothetical protein